MKKRFGLGIAIAAVAALALTGSTLAFTGLTNGSFEDTNGTYVDVSGGFEELPAGDTSIEGWTIGGTSVDWISYYWPAADGDMSIDLSGTNAGSLSQTFDTTVGALYRVSFDLSGNPAGLPAVKTLDVSESGGTTSTYSYDTVAAGNTLTDMMWSAQIFSFTATSASTTLIFTSTTPGAFGPALDGVSVVGSATTFEECKNGGWQTAFDASGNGFKNQGDCVSYVATKGKNLGAVPAAAPAETAAAEAATADAGDADTDQATSATKHSEKHHVKVTTRHVTERHDAKDKSKAHGGHHGSHH